jgi:hypothetical protein
VSALDAGKRSSNGRTRKVSLHAPAKQLPGIATMSDRATGKSPPNLSTSRWGARQRSRPVGPCPRVGIGFEFPTKNPLITFITARLGPIFAVITACVVRVEHIERRLILGAVFIIGGLLAELRRPEPAQPEFLDWIAASANGVAGPSVFSKPTRWWQVTGIVRP